ncbi:hypothetical protein BSQ40_28880 [Serratia fonticola]|nr:hypothetical protein BSQ40_28880 [Serratia fonticola]
MKSLTCQKEHYFGVFEKLLFKVVFSLFLYPSSECSFRKLLCIAGLFAIENIFVALFIFH